MHCAAAPTARLHPRPSWPAGARRLALPHPPVHRPRVLRQAGVCARGRGAGARQHLRQASRWAVAQLPAAAPAPSCLLPLQPLSGCSRRCPPTKQIAPQPLLPAGPGWRRAKLEGEELIRRRWPRHAILRSSIIYGPEPPLQPVGRTLFLQFIDTALAAGVSLRCPAPLLLSRAQRCAVLPTSTSPCPPGAAIFSLL